MARFTSFRLKSFLNGPPHSQLTQARKINLRVKIRRNLSMKLHPNACSFLSCSTCGGWKRKLEKNLNNHYNLFFLFHNSPSSKKSSIYFIIMESVEEMKKKNLFYDVKQQKIKCNMSSVWFVSNSKLNNIERNV